MHTNVYLEWVSSNVIFKNSPTGGKYIDLEESRS